MPKYKVGDKVKVKNHRVVNNVLFWDTNMDEMLGKTVTIASIDNRGYYTLEETPYWWCDEMFEGLAQTTGNEIIDLFMEKLGVEINEEFEIVGWESTSPYHFNEDGELIDCFDADSKFELLELIYKRLTIKKIPKPEIKEMTVAELEEALNFPKGTLRVKGDD